MKKIPLLNMSTLLGTIDTTRNVVVPTIRAPDACRRTNGSKKKKIMSHSEKNWEQRFKKNVVSMLLLLLSLVCVILGKKIKTFSNVRKNVTDRQTN